MDCTPTALAQAAKCWCLPEDARGAAWVFLLCKWLQGRGPLAPPFKATNPSPASGATGVNPINPVLSWTNGGGATSYDVWFNGAFIGNQAGTTFDPGVLADLASYAWRIDSVNAAGTTTGDAWVLNTGVASGFSFAPDTLIIQWTDSGGAHSGNLAAFNASPNRLTTTIITANSLGLTSITGLQSLAFLNTLGCSGNGLTALDVSGCAALINLSCGSNIITSLNVIGCTALDNIDCGGNSLTSLDVSGLVGLTSLNCYGNAITSLNVIGCTSLTSIDCTINSLTVHSVNTVLSSLVTNGATGGSVDTSGQIPSASPSVGPPNGIAASAILQAEIPPWTVITD